MDPLLARLRRHGLVDTEWVDSIVGSPRCYRALTPKAAARYDVRTAVAAIPGGHLLDLVGRAAVGVQEARERLHRLMIPALNHEHATPLLQVREDRDVVMAAAAGGLIEADTLNTREVLGLDGLIDVVVLRMCPRSGVYSPRRDTRLLDAAVVLST